MHRIAWREIPPLDRLKKVLIVRQDRIGDVVLTLPMASALRLGHPDLAVHLLLRGYVEPLVRRHPHIERTLVLPEKIEQRVGLEEFARILRGEAYDLAIVPNSKGFIGKLLHEAGIPLRYGSGLRLHSWHYNIIGLQSRKRPKQHELDYNLELLGGLAEIPRREEIRFHLDPGPEGTERARRFLANRKVGRYCVVHPGSGGSALNLPVATLAEVIDRYPFGMDLVVTGSEDERNLYRQLSKDTGRPLIDAVGAFDLETLTAILADCELFIGNSTGPLHIARALDRRVLAFYSTHPACHPIRWGPFGQERTHVVIPPNESFDHYENSWSRSSENMKRITSGSIIERLKEISA